MTQPPGPQTIRLSAGAVEYTDPVVVTELSGADTSADSLVASFGTLGLPGSQWVVPAVLAHGTTTVGTYAAENPDTEWPDSIDPVTDSDAVLYTITYQVLVGAGAQVSMTRGDYWMWAKIGDHSEVVPRVCSLIRIR